MTALAPAHITTGASDGSVGGLITTKPTLNIDPTVDMNRVRRVDGK